MLRTEDGGYLWQTCAIPPGAEKLDFRGVQAFDENTAIVMSSGPGDQSRLYKTTDGCQTWKLIFTNPDKDGFWDSIRFDFLPKKRQSNDHRSGVLVGDPVNGQFAVYTTQNGGDSWEIWAKDDEVNAYKRLGPINANTRESLFAASNSVVVTLRPNEIRFITGGEGGSRLFSAEPHNPFDNETKFKFTVTKLPFSSNKSSGAFSIASRQTQPYKDDLMVVGGNYESPDSVGACAYLPHRENNSLGGVVFFGSERQRVISSTTPPHGYRSAVAWDADQKLWITVGPNGTDISNDDGKNWRPLTPSPTDPEDTDKNWNALSLPFVVGPHGRIGRLRTIDQKAAVTKKP
ncbi:WD40/YVTN/BNR-like repeat-containing protein [Tunturiibacter gelidoferens]|uniref:Glycosyl hydrolase n=1 Tax=Tunturiibacter gelidiferens TaxID=3069689 RepID=A0AAU7Z026_9BACT